MPIVLIENDFTGKSSGLCQEMILPLLYIYTAVERRFCVGVIEKATAPEGIESN